MGIIRDDRATPILDLPFNIAHNELPDAAIFYKFGRISGLDNAVKTVWTGSMEYVFPAAPTPMAFASTNSCDACSGSIIFALEVQYLDSSWDMMTEVHCLNGLTPVDLGNNVTRVNRMRVLCNCGTLVNTGQIWLGSSDWTTGIPDNKYGHIESGVCQTYQGFYSVPRGHDIYIYDRAITINEGKQAYIYMHARDNAAVYSGFPGLGDTLQHKNRYELFQAAFPMQNKVPQKYTQRTDLEFQAFGEAGGGVDLSVEWGFLLVSSAYPNSG